jgi:hypothetical protein
MHQPGSVHTPFTECGEIGLPKRKETLIDRYEWTFSDHVIIVQSCTEHTSYQSAFLGH